MKKEIESSNIVDGMMEFKFKGDEKTYVQVSNEPGKNNLFKIGLVEKGTPINISTDNRFYIVVKQGNEKK